MRSRGAAIGFIFAWAFGVGVATAALAEDRPLGEPLSAAAGKFGLSAADVAAIRGAGGEFSCPARGSDGARLNAWLLSDRMILTNAHAIIEGETDPGHPYLRQPLAECSFVSFLDLGQAQPPAYRVNLNGLGAVLRPGARAPVDPTLSISGDVVRLRLAKPVAHGAALPFDFSPVAEGDSLLLVSRVPTAYRTDALPGDDLLIERCTVTSLDPPSPTYSRAALTDCNGAGGMSAGLLLSRVGDRLTAKGFLVALDFVRSKDGGGETVISVHNLLFDAKFSDWLGGNCPFWPAALLIDFCGVRP